MRQDVVERLRCFREMLSHADAMALKPSAPNQVETTQITTTESRLLQAALSDVIAALEATDAVQDDDALIEEAVQAAIDGGFAVNGEYGVAAARVAARHIAARLSTQAANMGKK